VCTACNDDHSNGRVICKTAFSYCWKPWKHLPTSGNRISIIVYGLSLGGMNILFYYAIERIPLGIGVALEFTGPLAVALFSSRRKRDLFWVACAIAGILLLLPDMSGQDSLDPLGVALALGAGACWAAYILFGKKTGTQSSGGATVALGMTVAAIVLVPYGGILQSAAFTWVSHWVLALLFYQAHCLTHLKWLHCVTCPRKDLA